MALDKYTKAQIYQRAVGRTAKAKGLVKVIEDSDGNLKFISTFDGKVSSSVADAIEHVESTGIEVYRSFGSDPHGSRLGLNQIADEADFLTQRLSNLKESDKRVLKRLGLDFLIGEKIDVSYRKYDQKASKIKQILSLQTTQDAGIRNITDEGVTVVNYSVGKRYLSAQQSKDLRYVMGIGTLTDDFVFKVLGNEIGGPKYKGPGELKRFGQTYKKSSRYDSRKKSVSYW